MPPLPDDWMWDESYIYDAAGDAMPAADYVKAYALQAVRDALERAAKMVEQGWVEQRNAGISDAIRALLKEYE